MKKVLFLMAVVAGFALAGQPVYAAKSASTCVTIQSGGITDSLGNPLKVGYDQWGYNYQARSFNGWLMNYTRPTPPVISGDELSMKWNDAWLSNKDCDGDGLLDIHYGYPTYRDSGAWLTNHASGEYEMHTVTGAYVVDFEYLGGHYDHDMNLTEGAGGSLTGDGGYPAGGPFSYNWVITGGSVVGNTVTLTATYLGGPDAAGTVMHMTGTVAADGSMSGIWDDNYMGGYRTGTWTTQSGVGTTNVCTWSDFVKVVAMPSSAHLVAGMWYTADNVEIGPEIWGEFAIIQEKSSNPCGMDIGLMNYRSQLRSGLGHWAE